MQKSLFLLCPTDCLESTINRQFKYENYFYASLGNSFIYDKETINHIKKLVLKHHIRAIYFVLSNDNQIILDALGNQDFSDIRKLNDFYKQITKHKEHLNVTWRASHLKFSIISYYLNIKIKHLQKELKSLFNHSIKIGGKVYHKQDKIFTAIYSDLIYIEKYHLN